MVATSSSQLINVNLIVRGTIIWCKNIYVYATRMHINWRPSLPGSSKMQSELTCMVHVRGKSAKNRRTSRCFTHPIWHLFARITKKSNRSVPQWWSSPIAYLSKLFCVICYRHFSFIEQHFSDLDKACSTLMRYQLVYVDRLFRPWQSFWCSASMNSMTSAFPESWNTHYSVSTDLLSYTRHFEFRQNIHIILYSAIFRWNSFYVLRKCINIEYKYIGKWCMYLGPVLTWSCTQLTHEGQFGCFHIVYNWPTSSYPKVLNSEKWDALMAKLNTRRGRV